MFSKVRSENLEVRSEKKKVESLFFMLFFLCSIFFSISANAQCAMCRAALTSEGNAVKAEAVNDGIVYLMVIPYLIVGVVGFFVYRMYSKKT